MVVSVSVMGGGTDLSAQEIPKGDAYLNKVALNTSAQPASNGARKPGKKANPQVSGSTEKQQTANQPPPSPNASSDSDDPYKKLSCSGDAQKDANTIACVNSNAEKTQQCKADTDSLTKEIDELKTACGTSSDNFQQCINNAVICSQKADLITSMRNDEEHVLSCKANPIQEAKDKKSGSSENASLFESGSKELCKQAMPKECGDSSKENYFKLYEGLEAEHKDSYSTTVENLKELKEQRNTVKQSLDEYNKQSKTTQESRRKLQTELLANSQNLLAKANIENKAAMATHQAKLNEAVTNVRTKIDIANTTARALDIAMFQLNKKCDDQAKANVPLDTSGATLTAGSVWNYQAVLLIERKNEFNKCINESTAEVRNAQNAFTSAQADILTAQRDLQDARNQYLNDVNASVSQTSGDSQRIMQQMQQNVSNQMEGLTNESLLVSQKTQELSKKLSELDKDINKKTAEKLGLEAAKKCANTVKSCFSGSRRDNNYSSSNKEPDIVTAAAKYNRIYGKCKSIPANSECHSIVSSCKDFRDDLKKQDDVVTKAIQLYKKDSDIQSEKRVTK